MGEQFHEIYNAMSGPVGLLAAVMSALFGLMQWLIMRRPTTTVIEKPREDRLSTRRKGAYFRSEAAGGPGFSLWPFIVSTLGLFNLGIAWSALQISHQKHDLGLPRDASDFAWISVIAASVGLILVLVSMVLIMRRLRTLAD